MLPLSLSPLSHPPCRFLPPFPELLLPLLPPLPLPLPPEVVEEPELELELLPLLLLLLLLLPRVAK